MVQIYIMIKKTRIPTPTFPKRLALLNREKRGPRARSKGQGLSNKSHFEFHSLQENITYLVFLPFFYKYWLHLSTQILNMSTSLCFHLQLDPNTSSSPSPYVDIVVDFLEVHVSFQRCRFEVLRCCYFSFTKCFLLRYTQNLYVFFFTYFYHIILYQIVFSIFVPPIP